MCDFLYAPVHTLLSVGTKAKHVWEWLEYRDASIWYYIYGYSWVYTPYTIFFNYLLTNVFSYFTATFKKKNFQGGELRTDW